MIPSCFQTIRSNWSRGALAAVLALWFAVAAFAQADGSPRWAGPFTTGGYIVSAPAVGADGTIYVGTQDKYLYAINSTGTLKWRFLTGDWVDSSPAIGTDGTIYFGSWDGKLYALTPAGTKLWEFSTGAGNYIYSSPAIGADGTIYFGAGDGNFYAVRANGTLKWTYPAGDWIDSSPAIGANGLLYYGSWDGNIYALRDEGDTAKEVWRFATNGPVLTSPALARDGTVYVGANDGRVYALDGATGAKRWDFQAQGTLAGSPVVGPDGVVYFGSDGGFLHAVQPDGTEKWKAFTTDPIASTPAVRADGTIIYGTGSSTIVALNSNGTQKWKVNAGDWVDSSPVVAPNGTIYVGSYDKKLYAFNGSGAPLSGFSEWPTFRQGALHGARVVPLPPGGRLLNISTRAQAGPGINLIPGFVVTGNGAKPFLVRAIGPTLVDYFVPGPLADPKVELVTAGQASPLGQNDNWNNALAPVMLAAGAFALPPNSKDAVVHHPLGPGSYTALASSTDSTSGLALVEVYDAERGNPNARLINLSTRGLVGTGAAVLTSGLVFDTAPLRLLIRAVGPTLADYGVPGTLARPTITVYLGQTPIATNTGWATGGYAADLRAAAGATGGFALGESNSDSAVLITLQPGAYTAQISGVNDTTGEVLVEVYLVP